MRYKTSESIKKLEIISALLLSNESLTSNYPYAPLNNIRSFLEKTLYRICNIHIMDVVTYTFFVYNQDLPSHEVESQMPDKANREKYWGEEHPSQLLYGIGQIRSQKPKHYLNEV
jgi:hypothetical protein